MNSLSWIVISIFMLISTGCATSSMYPIGEDFSSVNVSQIEKGKTTKGDIVKMFGKPFTKTVSTVSDNYEMWMYVYITETERDQSDVVTMVLDSDVATTGVASEDQNTFDLQLNDGIILESNFETGELESEVVSTELAKENQSTFDILLKNGIISESDDVTTELGNKNQKTFDEFLENAIVSTTDVATLKVKSRGNKKTLDVLMKRGVVSGFTFTDWSEPYIEDPTESELGLMSPK